MTVAIDQIRAVLNHCLDTADFLVVFVGWRAGGHSSRGSLRAQFQRLHDPADSFGNLPINSFQHRFFSRVTSGVGAVIRTQFRQFCLRIVALLLQFRQPPLLTVRFKSETTCDTAELVTDEKFESPA